MEAMTGNDELCFEIQASFPLVDAFSCSWSISKRNDSANWEIVLFFLSTMRFWQSLSLKIHKHLQRLSLSEFLGPF